MDGLGLEGFEEILKQGLVGTTADGAAAVFLGELVTPSEL